MPSDIRNVEDSWLEWAKPILGRTCCVSTPASNAPLHERILWPGYVGSTYERGRVLFVGAVHNAGQLYTEPIIDLARAANDWITSDRKENGRNYAREARSAYIKSAQTWARRGMVWRSFKTILSDLELRWQDVAFCNAAKCCTPVGQGYKERVDGCHGSSLERLPIKELDPVAVFVCCGRLQCWGMELAACGRMVRIYNQRNYLSRWPTQDKWQIWRAADKKRYHQIRP